MKLLRNILAIIGVIAIASAAWYGPKAWKYYSAFKQLDEKAYVTYKTMFDDVLKTGNAAAATVWKAEVAEGLTFDEVHESIKQTAIANNIRDVGMLPLGDQVGKMRGKPWRRMNIYLYCNPLTAAKMVDHHPAYSAYLPCRIALVEDKNKKLWIYTLNMDMMIYGGKTLPPDLLKEALHVKKIMKDILKKAAEGDF